MRFVLQIAAVKTENVDLVGKVNQLTSEAGGSRELIAALEAAKSGLEERVSGRKQTHPACGLLMP